jgi:arabinose-5-phosphate isomerase
MRVADAPRCVKLAGPAREGVQRPAMARATRSTARKPRLRAIPGSAPAGTTPEPSAPSASSQDEREATLAYARSVLEAEAQAILGLMGRLGDSFLRALELVRDCPGQTVVTGMGKAGLIGQKLSATLASTGIRSVFLHPAEAVHGDLGRVGRGDVILALSNSGASEELVRLLPSFKRLGAPVVAITGDPDSPLARGSEVVLDIGRIEEACPMGMVPTASTAALHAIGDALAMAVLRARPFGSAEYALLHPGGKIGRSVMRVFELMRSGNANPVVRDSAKLSEAVVVMTNTPGRPGATNVVDRQGRLVGIFTDGDLRRLVERGETNFDRPIREVMGKRPRCVGPEVLALEATKLMREFRVDQLPVVDAEGKAVGLLDVQDLLAARYF